MHTRRPAPPRASPRPPEAYWITLCTYRRRPLLGSVERGILLPSAAGRIVRQEWLRVTRDRPGLRPDCFAVLPDRFHAILWLADPSPSWVDRVSDRRRRSPALTSVLASFKAAGTAQIRLLFDDPTLEVWQPNYFEHVIRDEARLSRVRRYIQENPARGPDRVWSGP